MQQMETTVAKQSVHMCRVQQQQHCANNGDFSIVRAALHFYVPCVGGAFAMQNEDTGGSTEIGMQNAF